MTPTIHERAGQRLKLQATLNGAGRLRYAVSVFEMPDKLITTDTLNLASEAERKKLLGAVPDEHHLELLRLAVELGTVVAQLTPDSQGVEPSAVPVTEPWPDPVDGAELLDEIAGWLTRYVHFRQPEAARANALWSLATWCADHVHFAPLLAILSATKRAGKTTLLALLNLVVRRSRLTSAYGASAAVIFRLNEAQHPTFLIDEAERLGGRNANPDLVNLLNQGHRRGGVVSRCVEKKEGWAVEDYDAFGFRAVALIGKPWDTLTDRAVIVYLDRKPQHVTVQRYDARRIEREGGELARRAARWATDNGAAVGECESGTPRPEWLNDRGCDNWAPLFAVAELAGGGWAELALETAQALQPGDGDEDGDRGERLIRDLGRIFGERHQPPVIPSGDVVLALNELEESSWADDRGGKGLSTHRLAALLRPFGLRPRLARHPATDAPTRGYWWPDLVPLLERYASCSPSQTVTTVTDSPLASMSKEQAELGEAFRNTSAETAEPVTVVTVVERE